MNIIEKSEPIRVGLRKGFQDGTSKMAQRKCYGYDVGADGELMINPDEAAVVRWIFDRYLTPSEAGIHCIPQATVQGNFREVDRMKPVFNIYIGNGSLHMSQALIHRSFPSKTLPLYGEHLQNDKPAEYNSIKLQSS